MTQEEIKEYIEDHGYDSVMLFESPDYHDAFIGISTDDRAVYSFSRMVESLMAEDGMSEDDAIEFIEFNTIRALPYMGSESPIVVRDECLS